MNSQTFQCPNCFYECYSHNKFCPECGTPLTEINKQRMVQSVGYSNKTNEIQRNIQPAKTKISVWLVLTLICGILAILTMCVPVLSLLFALFGGLCSAGYIASHKGKKKAVFWVGIGCSIFAGLISWCILTAEKKSEESQINNTVVEDVSPIIQEQNSVEENNTVMAESHDDDRAEWAREKLPYPSEEQIIVINDLEAFYDRFNSADEDKWYQLSGKIYLVSDNSIVFHNELDSAIGMIQIEFPDDTDLSSLVKGDEITVVAHSYMKVLTSLMMNSGYIVGYQKTAFSSDNDTVYYVDDYVKFWRSYDNDHIGLMVQMSVPIDSVDNDGFIVREGLGGALTAMISVDMAEGESLLQINPGDRVSIYGECGAKVMNSVSIRNAHFGMAPGRMENYADIVGYSIIEEQEKGYSNDSSSVNVVDEPLSYKTVSVDSLYNELNNNAMNAKDTYLHSYIEVSGYVDSIDASGKYFTINNGEKYTLDSVQCFIENDSQREKLSRLSQGQYVTVSGKVSMVGEVLGYSIRLTEIK